MNKKNAATVGKPPSPPPARGPSLLLVLALVLLAAFLFWAGGAWGKHLSSGFATLLHSLSGDTTGDRSAGASYYSCGMHPWVILPKPGLCPVCHMDLTPIDPAKFTGEIAVDPRVVMSMGVRVKPVITGPLVRTIRTVGTVDYDETLVRDVNIKVKGWIEKLFVNYLGAEVREGEPLFDLFSRELYDTQKQYLLALRGRREQKTVTFLPRVLQDAQELLESTRTRLEYYDITPDEIKKLEETGKPSKTMTIVSPHTGVVISKHANEGMLVDPGMLVYRIADLSKVWVLVTLFEYQLPYVEPGQRAVMTLPYIPGETFEGRVVYMYPFLERKTREVQVRLEFDNPNLLLRPGMFANVELKSTLAQERTLAPRAAVIDTGERQVAFVSLGEGRFDPRNVRMGIETDGGMVEILDGLRPGELVVTSAQFLLDSEAKMREALARMVKGELASEQKALVAVAGVSELKALPPAASAALSQVLEGYFTVGDQLAADKNAGIAAPGRQVAQGIDTLLQIEIPENPHFWREHTEAAIVRGKALELVKAADLEEARLKFADLSFALAKLVRATGVPPSFGREVQELRCPMYREDQGGGFWLQPAGDVRNPFFGSMMLRCFDKRATLPVTGGSEEDVKAPPPTKSAEKDRAADQSASREEARPVEKAAPAEEQASTTKDDRSLVKTEAPSAPTDPGREFAGLLDAYFDVGDRLARDTSSGIATPARKVARGVDNLVRMEIPNKPQFWHQRRETATVRQKALELIQQSDLARARQTYADLSLALAKLLKVTGVPRFYGREVQELHCPMYRDGAYWLQPAGQARNPFFGSQMLRCFDRRVTLPVVTRLGETTKPEKE